MNSIVKNKIPLLLLLGTSIWVSHAQEDTQSLLDSILGEKKSRAKTTSTPAKPSTPKVRKKQTSNSLAKKGPTLTFVYPKKDASGQEMERMVYLSELAKSVPSKVITHFDPLYRKSKRYRSFALKDVLKLMYGTAWQKSKYSDIEFTSIKGDISVAKTYILRDDGAYIGFEDVDRKGWEKFPTMSGKRGANHPGPYYLFWVGVDQKSSEEYLWFWQMKSMRLVEFEKRYAKVVPQGADPKSSVYRGYEIFRGQCFRCHSMNRQGGKIGPDLNEPTSVVTYRDVTKLKSFIHKVSDYRYSNMPDFTHLTKKDLNDLVSYFTYKDKNR